MKFPRTLLVLSLLAQAGLAAAQQPAATPKPSPEPRTERLEEESGPTLPPREPEHQVTEKRDGGRVVEVKVKSGNSRYIMRPNNPAGNAQVGDVVSNSIRAPQWQVMEFDILKKPKTDPEDVKEGVPVLAPAPPPPQTVPEEGAPRPAGQGAAASKPAPAAKPERTGTAGQ
jgi:hypothetical protein